MEKLAAALLSSTAPIAPGSAEPKAEAQAKPRQVHRRTPRLGPLPTRHHRQQHRAQKAAADDSGTDGDGGDGENPDQLVPDPKVQAELGGISAMTLWRWTNHRDYFALGFPPPIKINGRNYRSRRALEAWKARMLRQAMAERAALRMPSTK